MPREQFSEILLEGDHANSLGRSAEVLALVLDDAHRMEELYECLFADDAWVRMRTADTIEKVCRIHPDWLEAYIDRLIGDLSKSTQPSIQWHLAQIYRQVKLSKTQKSLVLQWLEDLLSSTDVDWIVAANVMDTLARFTSDGSFPKSKLISILQVQSHHHSKSVVRRVEKLQESLG